MDDALEQNLSSVRSRIAAACQRVGRRGSHLHFALGGQVPNEDVTPRLVAVTKSVGADVIRALARLGVTDIGENRVQDALAKQESLGGTLGLRWHMIGHLQTNKVRHAVRLFDAIHSVDSLHLAVEIDRRASGEREPPSLSGRGQGEGGAPAQPQARPSPYPLPGRERGLGGEGRSVPVLIECNVSGEAGKFGVEPQNLDALLEGMRPLQHVRVEGLMTMAPFVDDPEAARPVFAALRELAAKARAATGLPLPHLSMGMTQDFEVAIEEGATMVRIGTALFRGI